MIFLYLHRIQEKRSLRVRRRDSGMCPQTYLKFFYFFAMPYKCFIPILGCFKPWATSVFFSTWLPVRISFSTSFLWSALKSDIKTTFLLWGSLLRTLYTLPQILLFLFQCMLQWQTEWYIPWVSLFFIFLETKQKKYSAWSWVLENQSNCLDFKNCFDYNIY